MNYELWNDQGLKYFNVIGTAITETNGEVCIVWIRKCMTDARQRTVCSRWKKSHLYQYICAVRGYGNRDVTHGARFFYLYYRQDNTQAHIAYNTSCYNE